MQKLDYGTSYIGQSISFSKTITEKDMLSFNQIVQDQNPIHTNQESAQSFGFREKVIYGMLCSSLTAKIADYLFPEKCCLILQVNYRFVNPAFVGDELSIKGTILELNEGTPRSTVAIEITSNARKIVKGKMIVGFIEEKQNAQN